MAYTRLHWVESETPLSAQNMNNIEDGIEELQSRKVDKASGKGLSTNDFTTAYKTKLNGIESGAEVNRSIAIVGHTMASNVKVYPKDSSMLQFSGLTSAYSYRAISSIKLLDTSQGAVELCIMNVESFSNGVRLYVYNPTSESITVSKEYSYVNVLCISI